MFSEQVTVTKVEDNRNYQKSHRSFVGQGIYSFPGQRWVPTWGPQPWHGYNIAVWFSSGPWSKQTSFALLLRSCKNRQNITHQSSSGRADDSQLLFHHACLGPILSMRGPCNDLWGDHFSRKDRVLQWMSCYQYCACDSHLYSTPISRTKKDLRKLVDIRTLVTHLLSIVGFGTNPDFNNPGNHRSASWVITGIEVAWKIVT